VRGLRIANPNLSTLQGYFLVLVSLCLLIVCCHGPTVTDSVGGTVIHKRYLTLRKVMCSVCTEQLSGCTCNSSFGCVDTSPPLR
jgi:uncharacterized membrane protein YiaA